MSKPFDSGLVWFRRDLRVDDHAALHLALQQCQRVYCAFIFDRDILDPLPRTDRRVEFIQASLLELDQGLRSLSGREHAGLIVRHGRATEALPALARQLGVQAVYAAHDYEPRAQGRDTQVRGALAALGIALHTCKDHVIYEGREILTGGGTPYTVFTPYKRAWLARLQSTELPVFDITPLAQGLASRPEGLRDRIPGLSELGFEPSNLARLKVPTGSDGGRRLLDDFLGRMDRYDEWRDYPAMKGPSYLGVHLRFGTVSLRRLVSLAQQRSRAGSSGAAVWLSELVWREFYFQILANFPHVAERAFKPAYDAISWEQGARAEALFAAWCEGRTGYPIVDAAMAQLNQSGYMHNRLRMVTGSFLVKDLGIDWRWGERYFAEKLNDFDLASNNGGWQWVASSGCDAQPWFRIFNPVSQSKKFDPQGRFIRRYLPQLAALPDGALHAPWLSGPVELAAAGVALGNDYPLPLVAHDEARARTLERYAVVKKAAAGE
jgi:deoxyribodipyrimidine photo-lyase